MSEIECDEIKHRMKKGEKLHFFDVREEWEYEEYNIGAQLLPLGEIPKRLAEIESLKEQEIILHCATGIRSRQAQKFLISKGFANVKYMIGGIEAYQKD